MCSQTEACFSIYIDLHWQQVLKAVLLLLCHLLQVARVLLVFRRFGKLWLFFVPQAQLHQVLLKIAINAPLPTSAGLSMCLLSFRHTACLAILLHHHHVCSVLMVLQAECLPPYCEMGQGIHFALLDLLLCSSFQVAGHDTI